MVATAIVGGTVDVIVLAEAGPVGSAGAAGVADGEIGTAATIDPNTLAIPAPGLTKGARRAAALINELNATAGVGGAILAAAVFGRAIITPSTKLVTLFNWRRIGRGVRKSSSSPPWALPV